MSIVLLERGCGSGSVLGMFDSRWWGAVGAACMMTCSAAAHAQDVAAAEALFNRGLERMEAGNYEKACPLLAESYRVDPRPGALFTLAECEARRGRIATAYLRYGEYLSLFERLPPDKRARQQGRDQAARQQRAALAPKVPEITLVVPPDVPAGIVVKSDGLEIAKTALGVPLPLEPGEHVVTLQVPGRPAIERRIVVAVGDKKHIMLDDKSPVVDAPLPVRGPAPADAPRPAQPMAPGVSNGVDWRLPAGIVGVGVGAAMLVTGIIGSVQVKRAEEAIAPAQAGRPSSFDVCSDVNAESLNLTSVCTRGKVFQTVQIIAYPTAAVFTGVGVYFLLTRRTTPPSVTFAPALGPGYAALDARWRF